MSFDPKSVLNRIRSKKKLEKSVDSSNQSPYERSALEVSVDRMDKSRDHAISSQTMYMMAEQIRYMQDHIKRLESQLDAAHVEISSLKEENRVLSHKNPSEPTVPVVNSKVQKLFSKRPSEVFSTRSPLTSKQKSIESTSRRETSQLENSHREPGSYFNMYLSGQSQKTDEFSQPSNFSTNGASSNSKPGLNSGQASQASDLRLHIIEKILAADTKMAVPQLRIVF